MTYSCGFLRPRPGSCVSQKQALWSEDVQEVLDACLFEPSQWQMAMEKTMPTRVPAETRDHLATPCGLLFNELLKSPKVEIKKK